MTPLSAPIPLRNSSVWAGYREAVAIPHRYGSASGSLIQYNATRTQFVWCDHAAQSIDTVLVGGQSVGDWVWRNAVDSTGHTVAMVEFGQPQDEGVTLFARGRGKRHPADGRAADRADGAAAGEHGAAHRTDAGPDGICRADRDFFLG